MENADGKRRTTEFATDEELMQASRILTRLHELHGMAYTDMAPKLYLSASYLGRIASMVPSSGADGFARSKVRQAIDLGGRLLEKTEAPAPGKGNGAPSMLTELGETFETVRDRLDTCLGDLERVRDEVAHPLLRPGIETMIDRVRDVRDLADGRGLDA